MYPARQQKRNIVSQNPPRLKKGRAKEWEWPNPLTFGPRRNCKPKPGRAVVALSVSKSPPLSLASGPWAAPSLGRPHLSRQRHFRIFDYSRPGGLRLEHRDHGGLGGCLRTTTCLDHASTGTPLENPHRTGNRRTPRQCGGDDVPPFTSFPHRCSRSDLRIRWTSGLRLSRKAAKDLR
jgi:hypothetical protein